MAEHTPNDLLIDILARLPVASLLRFTSVCKSWYSLITSPSFIAKHLNQTITNSRRNDDKILVKTCDNYKQKESYLLLHDNENFGDDYSELKFPFQHPYGYFSVVGSCNGLVCLYNCLSFQPRIILWNPSIRKLVTLPMPCKPQQPHMAVYGFGSHPTTLDYKVVWMRYEISHSFKLPPKVEVYTQGTRSWRGINSVAPHYMVNINWSQAFLNGFVNWVAYHPYEDGFWNLIMSFNMNSESFSEIKLPPTLADQPLASLSIKLLGEALAVLCRGERDGGGCCIWIMKEYGVSESWTKLFSSDLLGRPQKALGFRKNGEVLLASANSLASYAPGTKTLRDTGIRGISYAFCVDSFIETLVLAEKGNGVSQGQLKLS